LVRFRYYEPGYRERLKQLQATLPTGVPAASGAPAVRKG
jgi:hypothetical protein